MINRRRRGGLVLKFRPQPAKRQHGQGDENGSLLTVLEAFTSLRDDFMDKFRKVWA
jgi:hypothetical protein